MVFLWNIDVQNIRAKKNNDMVTIKKKWSNFFLALSRRFKKHKRWYENFWLGDVKNALGQSGWSTLESTIFHLVGPDGNKLLQLWKHHTPSLPVFSKLSFLHVC